jgi:hypothetical protein
MKQPAHTPDLTKKAFARTNLQTITQRVALLHELLPGITSIAELCCGDCTQQASVYRRELGIARYRGLDLVPEIVTANQVQGIDCLCGDVLDPAILGPFLDFEVIFYGPPLSVACDGHRLLTFRDVVPDYATVARLLLGELGYQGTLVCVCPNSTTPGDARWLYDQIQAIRPDVGLRLCHSSYATITSSGLKTEPRLKYVELWFSNRLADAWEMR